MEMLFLPKCTMAGFGVGWRRILLHWPLHYFFQKLNEIIDFVVSYIKRNIQRYCFCI